MGVGGVTRRTLQAENADCAPLQGAASLLGSWRGEAGPDQHLGLALLGLELDSPLTYALRGDAEGRGLFLYRSTEFP